MCKSLLVGLLCVASVTKLVAQGSQDASGEQRMNVLEARVQLLDADLAKARSALEVLGEQVKKQGSDQRHISGRVLMHDSLFGSVNNEAVALKNRTDTLRANISQQGVVIDGRIATLDQRTGLHWTLTLLLVGLLLGLLILAYLGLKGLLSKRVGAVGAKMDELNADVQAKLVKVDSDFITALEKLVEAKPLAPSPAAAEQDHSLALKVADEITRIEQNLAQMDPAVKGHKQLTAAVKRMNENLIAAGYQVPELLGKPFIDGMKVTATFIPDETLQKDEMIVTRIFKPTVIFNGKMIQAGDIQVSQG
jgi:hypothetical protein